MQFIRRHRFQYTLLFLLIVGLAAFLRYRLEWIDNQVFLASVAAFITVYLGLLRYQVDADRVFQELFTSFNAKYDGMNEKLERMGQNGLQSDRAIVVDYLNLCAEEYLWYRKGRIDEKVWKAWRAGMEQKFTNEHILRIAEEELEEAGPSYYGFLEHILNRVKK